MPKDKPCFKHKYGDSLSTSHAGTMCFAYGVVTRASGTSET